jgi:hypothetical protein
VLANGKLRAMYAGMLRIKLPTASNSDLLILEGGLTGLWAQELLRLVRRSGMVHGCLVDLQRVFPIDSVGEQALRILGGRGARFIADSEYHKDVCNRLRLHRVATSNLRNNNGKSPESSRKPSHRQAADAGGLDTLTGADANQHPTRTGE